MCALASPSVWVCACASAGVGTRSHDIPVPLSYLARLGFFCPSLFLLQFNQPLLGVHCWPIQWSSRSWISIHTLSYIIYNVCSCVYVFMLDIIYLYYILLLFIYYIINKNTYTRGTYLMRVSDREPSTRRRNTVWP